MKVGVLMGGVSSERDVSLVTGKSIVENLDRKKYEVIPIIIDSKEEVFEKVKGIDFAFLAFHGEFGEDGSIQSILEALNIPYSGSKALCSGICMNKKQTKRILKAEGIKTAKSVILQKGEKLDKKVTDNIGYPFVIKPCTGGSSIGVSIIKNKGNLDEAIELGFKYDNEIIIEEYLDGVEYTVPVLNGEALPILKIIPKGEFYDYSSKYDDGGSDKLEACLSKELENELKIISENCYKIFDCRSYVRVDFIVANGIPYVLELNTLPGMTSHSLFPISASAIGIGFSELIDKIIEYSLT